MRLREAKVILNKLGSDEAKKRISLGMKQFDFEDGSDDDDNISSEKVVADGVLLIKRR